MINPPIESSYDKVITTIESCNTKDQLIGAKKMLNNFKALYGIVGFPKSYSYSLDKVLNDKYIQLTCQL
jgi:hypothetical protein|tara:strand:- start:121 stop:327 length:207 start_codon:yes stop_codon:yes gene_type:complete